MDSGDYAWMLISTALVVFMIPGLALFYGGMTRSKNVLNMFMMNMYCVGIVPIVWVLLGYSLGNSPDGSGFFGGEWIGNFDFIGLKDLNADPESLIFVAFLMTFAAITPALISGAVADRLKFSAWVIFVPIWLLLVYCPATYWVYSGWHDGNGALDFAGGTAIHLNSGVAALAFVLVLGKRRGWPKEATPPHNMPMVLIGTAILWFGWFGGFVGGLASVVFGLVAGAVCYFAISLKTRFGYDDSLDVVGIHGVGGLTGGLLLGFFADSSAIPGGDFDDGLFFGGGIELLLDQVVAMLSVIVLSFIVTFVIVKIIDATIGLRVEEEVEQTGLDRALHAESAYND